MSTTLPPLSPSVEADIDSPEARPARAAEDLRTPLVRFFDAFLQERNIKWVLGVGTAIVLGSSLMLVASHWQQYTPVWKHLIMLGYTTLIACAGWWTYHTLQLHKTGTTLMALTVLLLPVMFLALHWVQPASFNPTILGESLTHRGPPGQDVLHLALLAVTALVAYLAASRIFHHFLRENHPTFLACYLTLCATGVILPLLPPAFAPVSAVALWTIASIGAVKVNRQVFWLVEEHRAPRILGFFPIALLSGQFLMLFSLHLVSHVALPWMGLGCALVSATVLLTADSVARVFQQRTGDLIRPLPAAIIAPMVVGLTFCAAGVLLAITGIGHPTESLAMAPTAAVAALLMFLVARRTHHTSFIWAGLFAVTLAYQFSPAFFRELAMHLIQSSAHLIQEERLPFAFYGLTYLPLVAGLLVTGVIAQRRGYALLAGPVQRYTTILSALLLVLSTGHPKAMAPVALVMFVLLAIQTRLFVRPHLAMLAIVAFLMSAFGFVDFLRAIEAWNLPGEARMFCMLVAAALLLLPGVRIDGALARMLRSSTGNENVKPFTPCANASLIVTILLAGFWAIAYGLGGVEGSVTLAWPAVAVGLGSLGMLVTHSLRRIDSRLGLAAIGLLHLIVLAVAKAFALDDASLLSIGILALIAQWITAMALLRRPHWRLTETFTRHADATATIGLYLALLVAGIVFATFELTGMPTPSPWWFCRGLLIAWGFVAAVRQSNSMISTTAAMALLTTAACATVAVCGPAANQWLPALWASISAASLLLTEVIRLRGGESLRQSIAIPVGRVAFGVLAGVALLSLVAFSMPMRVAAFTALAGLLYLGIVRRSMVTRIACFTLINWHLLALTVLLFDPTGMTTLLDLNSITLRAIAIPLALAAAASLLLWQQVKAPPLKFARDMIVIHRLLLALVSGLFLAGTMGHADLSAIELIFACMTFALLALSQFLSACRDRSEGDVWCGMTLVGLGVTYLAWHGVITFGSGRSMFLILGVAALLGLLAKVAARHEAITIMARPFRQSAMVLPMVTVVAGLMRHLLGAHSAWLGANSLALLLAGGFYFWHGMETKQRRFVVMAAGILNIALALLWNELALSDPQFFMIPLGMTILALVRLLKQEIPLQLREPLYYLGALVILVSPTFHIVGGSWIPLLSLMVLSVIVILAAIGFRVRPLVYTGTAFLMADIIAMIVRGSIAQPSILWIAGVALGASVVILGAIAERNREELIARVRKLSAAIAAWD